MTYAEQILVAAAELTSGDATISFSRQQIQKHLLLDPAEWLSGYTAIFQAMRCDHPGGAPPIGERYQDIFQRIARGKYILTDKGKALAREQFGAI